MGDIHPVSSTARLLVSGQMGASLYLLVVAVTTAVRRVSCLTHAVTDRFFPHTGRATLPRLAKRKAHVPRPKSVPTVGIRRPQIAHVKSRTCARLILLSSSSI
ncbi:hypothetical protein [Mycobacterium sp.]|uniref:hypothetical protein n=1 Tax=Mycobacterium sp. TaxID=1785 RepID=UPI003C71FD18